jgi:hypothetical protein
VKITRLWLRSVRGQLTLLGGAYLGAVALAVTALCLRSAVFERLVGETYRATPPRLAAVLRAVAAGEAGDEQLQALEGEEPDLLYEAWMADAGLDPRGRLARRLLSLHGPPMLERARRTLGVGTPAQRGRALELLAWAGQAELRPEVVRLARYALERARRRGEDDLARRATELLARAKAD